MHSAFIPDKELSIKTKKRLKIILTAIAVCLLFGLFVGIVLLFESKGKMILGYILVGAAVAYIVLSLVAFLIKASKLKQAPFSPFQHSIYQRRGFMREISYDREAAVAYAEKWALKRNPAYYDFQHIGGDCTNFASQCIYAGAKVMNFTPDVGWYYRSLSDRAAAWSGVEYLYKFLVNNRSVGPFGHIVGKSEAMPGDIVQLGTSNGRFYHSPVITKTNGSILVAAHTFDALNRPLSSYSAATIRFIHIDGVRIW